MSVMRCRTPCGGRPLPGFHDIFEPDRTRSGRLGLTGQAAWLTVKAVTFAASMTETVLLMTRVTDYRATAETAGQNPQ